MAPQAIINLKGTKNLTGTVSLVFFNILVAVVIWVAAHFWIIIRVSCAQNQLINFLLD
jgi:hypothetical protein